MDDLDLLLAGAGDTKAAGKADGGLTAKQETARDGIKGGTVDASEPARTSYVCIVCRSHYVELYALPSFALIFRCRRFSAARQTLIDAADEQSPSGTHTVLDDNLPAHY